jgi:hypothetical protein
LEQYLKLIDEMKKLFTLSFTCFLAFALHAQTATLATNTGTQSNKNIPAIATQPPTSVDEVLVLKETEYDFGKIPQGKPVTHVFEVLNNGKDSLKIINVQASCGCTTPYWEKNKIQAPKEKTKITVGYNAASEGVFTKVITITYNGSLTKQIIIKGEVWKIPATSAPENKELGSLQNL